MMEGYFDKLQGILVFMLIMGIPFLVGYLCGTIVERKRSFDDEQD